MSSMKWIIYVLLISVNGERLKEPGILIITPPDFVIHIADTNINYQIQEVIVSKDTIISVRGISYHGLIWIKQDIVRIFLIQDRNHLDYVFVRNRKQINSTST